MAKIAIIRIRGKVNTRKVVNDTLDMLRLHDKNFCTVVEDTPQIKGMIQKVKDFVTFGSISEETFKELISKRGEEYKGRTEDSKGKIKYSRKYFEDSGKKYYKYFRLNPPKGGYGRKGIKKSFSVGGALGNRKDKINDLLGKMI